MKSKAFLFSGALATFVYVFAVILGGILRPEYSHAAEAISSLIGSGAPYRSLLNPFFALYNLFTGAFAVGLFFYVRSRNGTSGKFNPGTVGAVVLIAEAVFGFVTVFFPQDAGGLPPKTMIGTMHIILAGLTSVTTMATMLLMAIWFKRMPGLSGLSTLSWVCLAVVFLSGGLTAAVTANGGSIMGLLERITIGGFLVWMLVAGLKLNAALTADHPITARA